MAKAHIIRRHSLAAPVVLLIVFVFMTLGFISLGVATAFSQTRGSESMAPRDGMLPGRWSSGIKQFFGTSFEAYDSDIKYSSKSPTAPISRIWFTGAQGILTEVFWPTIDTPQVRDSQFLVTDGKSFLFEERKDAETEVRWLVDGVPIYQVINQDRERRFKIERIIYTDPDRDSVIQRIKITRSVPGLQFYLLHNPAVGNSPLGDDAFTSLGSEKNSGLYASQGAQAQALLSSVKWKAASASFAGPHDGYQDLARDFKMDLRYEQARNGEVVLLGWLDLDEAPGVSELTLVLGMGESVQAAHQTARATLDSGLDRAREAYISQWQGHLRSVRDLSDASTDQGRLFRASVSLLKSMEDKTFEGAFVASPGSPWGQHQVDQSAGPLPGGSRKEMSGGYHLVWPRDLYQMATTMMALEDYSSAIASLNRLKGAQLSHQDGEWMYSFRRRSKDGSFPQNFWANGEMYWGGLQMDEVAMPVVLAYRLWQAGKINWADYWDMVRRASDFIADFGPWSAQERWEESFGASPSTIAAQIAALWSAAEFAKQAGDHARAQRYQSTGDAWSSKPHDNLNTWTFTRTGGHGNGKYFIRVEGASFYEQLWDPNDDTELYIANNGGRHREKDVIDGGFLELVRFGVRNAHDYAILESLPEYDSTIRVDVPGKGPGFRRYLYDRYNHDDFSYAQTEGMLWPLLSGERGHYELARAIEGSLKPTEIDAAIEPYILAMQNFATPSLMIPEQVWDRGPGAGQPTGSATPLGWAHGEYIKLLRSKLDRRVFDQVPAVTQRAHLLRVLHWNIVDGQ